MKLFEYIKRHMYIVAISLAILIVALLFAVPAFASSITVDSLYNLSNKERMTVREPALKLDEQLSSAALAKANNMIKYDYWAHNSPTDSTPWSFISKSGYVYETAGENLAKGFDTSSGVIAAWMASPSHKYNILNRAYKDVGYAVVDGKLTGKQTTLVVAMYGISSSSVAAGATKTSSSGMFLGLQTRDIIYNLVLALVYVLSVLIFIILLRSMRHKSAHWLPSGDRYV